MSPSNDNVIGRLILVRHGQSHSNVARRLDTRPPGAELTDLGREQAREFARTRPRPPGLLLHSIAHRAAQTAVEIGAEWSRPTIEVEGIHEVQAGDLEDRDDDEAIAAFNSANNLPTIKYGLNFQSDRCMAYHPIKRTKVSF